MDSFWNEILLGNTLQQWIIAISILVASFIVIRILKKVFLSKLRGWTNRTHSTLDDFFILAIEKQGIPFLYIFAVYAALNILELHPRVQKIADVAILVAGTYFVIRAIISAISFALNNYTSRHNGATTRTKEMRGIVIIINVILWLGGVVFLLDNFGYDITAIVAGLGIGGVAIALASQAVLADLFSYFVIFFDKPFEIGDFIIVDEKMGNVEYIGIKTTRLRTLGGEQLVFSNTDLTNSRVHNYKRMQHRRIEFSFKVIHNTSIEKLRTLPSTVKDIVQQQPKTRFDRAHFKSIGDSGLDFEVIYFIESPDYNFFMDTQQAINLALYAHFEKEDLHFAHPTQTVHLQKADENDKEEPVEQDVHY